MMSVPISLFIAFRYWRAKSADRFGRLVTNLAMMGIVLGIMALIIVLSVMNGLENQQKKQVLSSIPHAIIMPLAGHLSHSEPIPSMPTFVQNVVPINTTNVILQAPQGVSAGQVIGIARFSDDPLLQNFATQSFEQVLPEGEFKLIVGSQLAEKLHLQIGDKVRLMITENSQYTPFGRVPVQRLFTISDIYFSAGQNDTNEMFANLSDIGRLMRIPSDQMQGYRLFLKDPFDITELPQYFPSNKWLISDWRSQKGEFFQAVKMEKNMMGLLISLIIVVAISNIITSLSLMVVDKQGEIAILQTQGLNKSEVRNLFIWQGLLVGLSGTLVGTMLGVLTTLNLDRIMAWFNPENIILPTELNLSQLIMIVGISLLFSLGSTIYPAYRAAQIEPAEALRYE